MKELIYLTYEDIHCIGEALSIKNIKDYEHHLKDIVDDPKISAEPDVFNVAGNYMLSMSGLDGVGNKKQLAFLTTMIFLMMNSYETPASPGLVRLTEFACKGNSSLQEVAFCLRFMCFS